MGKAGAINDRGEVAGFSSVPGDSSVHPFLWTAATGMQDLGPLGTDFLADPAGINNSTQVVGGSCDISGNCRAFFWENNVMSDLNDLIPANSPWYLAYALGINDAGEIVGFAVEKSTGNTYAYLASPVPSPAAKPSRHANRTRAYKREPAGRTPRKHPHAAAAATALRPPRSPSNRPLIGVSSVPHVSGLPFEFLPKRQTRGAGPAPAALLAFGPPDL